MRKVLVTGANSFIGRHLIPFLELSGYEVHGIARRNTDNTFPKIHLNSITKRPFILGDLSDEVFTNNLSFKPDSIVHLAANSDERSGAVNLIRDNILSTANLVLYSKRVSCQQIITSSSVSVHGQVLKTPLTLNSGYNDQRLYGLTKRLSEIILENDTCENNVILRLPSILGVGAKNHWISKVFKNAMLGEDIERYNSTGFFNNVVYINDLLEFFHKLLGAPQKGTYAFPIASTNPVTIKNVVDQIILLTGSNSSIIDIPTKSLSFTIDDGFARDHFSYKSLTTSKAIEKFVQDELILSNQGN